MKKIPTHPEHPERICWGCDKYCPADDLRCGNGSIRAQHPIELFGVDWQKWAEDYSGADEEEEVDVADTVVESVR